jgi:hypothetical protein
MNLDDLHRENLRRVSAMGDDEVAMAQQEILTMLSPEAIEILRGKAGLDAVKPAGKGGKRDEEPEKREAERRAELLRRKIDSEEALDRATRELLTEEERGAVDWFNAPPVKSGEEGQGDELRFDLEGGLIERERAEEIPTHSGLYHNPEQVCTPAWDVGGLSMCQGYRQGWPFSYTCALEASLTSWVYASPMCLAPARRLHAAAALRHRAQQPRGTAGECLPHLESAAATRRHIGQA